MKATTAQKSALRCYQEARDWHTPPECQGQTVVRSYGISPDYIYETVLDRSDDTLTITAYRHPPDMGEGDWAPWNGVPNVGRRVGVIYAGAAASAPRAAS